MNRILVKILAEQLRRSCWWDQSAKKIFDIADDVYHPVNMWVSEGASVLVKKSLSPLHSEYALPLRNKAYSNSGSLQELQKNPTASPQVNIRGAIGVQANIQGLKLKE